MVVISLFRDAVPIFEHGITLQGFLFSDAWSPLSEPPKFGIFHAWVSSLIICAGSLLLAVPLGVGLGIFLSDIAPRWMQYILQPCLELLAGIPSVVYGFFGYVVLVKNFESWFKMPTGECLLAAILILALMILPYIASTSAEALRAVPVSMRESAMSLGVSRFYCLRRVLIPAALPGLFTAVALGLARASGETLAVLMLAGNSLATPGSLFDRGQPLPALIATELGEAAVGTAKFHSIAAAGVLLLVITVLINAFIWSIKRRWVSQQ